MLKAVAFVADRSTMAEVSRWWRTKPNKRDSKMPTEKIVPTYRVWLGARASGWAHNGYTVRGAYVLCDDLADAQRVVAREFECEDMVAVLADGCIYYYTSQDEADDDFSGNCADASISRVEDDQ